MPLNNPKTIAAAIEKTTPAAPKTTPVAQPGTFQPNTEAPPTSDPVAAAKPGANAHDASVTDTVQSLTGLPLTGEALAKFQVLWKNNPMLQGMYNEDASIKEDFQSLIRE